MSLMCWREQHTADAECYLLVFACMRVYDDCMDELGGCVVLYFFSVLHDFPFCLGVKC